MCTAFGLDGGLWGADGASAPRRGRRGRAASTLGSTRRVAGTTSEDLRSEGYTDRGRGTYSSRPRPGYFAAFFLRSAQEAVIRSETAFFSSAVIGRRFLVGLASDAVSATGVAAAAGRREEERRAAGFAGAEVTSILSTSFNALISPCKRSISLWRSAIAFAMTLISFSQGLYRPSLDALWAPAPGAFQWVAILRHSNPDGLTVTPGVRVCGAG